MLVVNQTGGEYKTNTYRNFYNDWLSGSCGSRFEVQFNNTPIYGCAIYPGHHAKQFANAVETLTHINTKAGPITVRLRKAQYPKDIQKEMEQDE